MQQEMDWRTADYFRDRAAAKKAAALDPDLPNPERTWGGHRKTSKAELLEWHCTKDDYPDAEMKVIGQYLRSGVDSEPDFYMVYTDGENWFMSDSNPHYPCEEPDYWVDLGGVHRAERRANRRAKVDDDWPRKEHANGTL